MAGAIFIGVLAVCGFEALACQQPTSGLANMISALPSPSPIVNIAGLQVIPTATHIPVGGGQAFGLGQAGINCRLMTEWAVNGGVVPEVRWSLFVVSRMPMVVWLK